MVVTHFRYSVLNLSGQNLVQSYNTAGNVCLTLTAIHFKYFLTTFLLEVF